MQQDNQSICEIDEYRIISQFAIPPGFGWNDRLCYVYYTRWKLTVCQDRLGTNIRGQLNERNAAAVSRTERDRPLTEHGIVEPATWHTPQACNVDCSAAAQS